MKYLPLLIGIAILLSCSEQIKSSKVISESEENSEIVYLKLPTSKKNFELIKKLEFEEFWSFKSPKQIGHFFGQNLYLYTYEYDTIVNGTPILFLYQCIGEKNTNIVDNRMLDDLNSLINDMIETALIEHHKALYSIVHDEIQISDNLTYTRHEAFMTGGNEFTNITTYKIDEISSIDFFEDYDNYKSGSDFLKRRLISEINK